MAHLILSASDRLALVGPASSSTSSKKESNPVTSSENLGASRLLTDGIWMVAMTGIGTGDTGGWGGIGVVEGRRERRWKSSIGEWGRSRRERGLLIGRGG